MQNCEDPFEKISASTAVLYAVSTLFDIMCSFRYPLRCEDSHDIIEALAFPHLHSSRVAAPLADCPIG